jgi:hypothetical protein
VVVEHGAQRGHQRRIVLQRLAHAHHHHVGDDALGALQVLAQEVFGKPQLGDDFARAEVAAEALVPGGAESGNRPHSRPATTRTGAAVVLGNEYGFDGIAVPTSNSHLIVPSGFVLREDRQALDARGGRELLAQRLGQIGHLGEVAGATLVDPAEQLRGAETLLAELSQNAASPSRSNRAGWPWSWHQSADSLQRA